MRTLVTVLLSVLFFCLETTILKNFEIRGITPNLLIILVVSLGILRGSKTAGTVGLFIGALQDILFYPVFGFQTLMFFYIGYVAGFFNKDFYKENYVLPFVLIFTADFIYGLLVYVFTYLFTGHLNIWQYITNIILPEMIYTLLIGLFVYKFLYFIDDRLNMYERKRYSRIR
ncbi:rod shape-determining protein MreD [Vallitalea okinawensis]|uniref:rod shape-determining protein MreD n=1 Tax=Vallitalea okinawensis TaxID=2078660 RepID=UPI0013005DF8|nr:rod shape-determining protein MreD [Vallitalea okinawensis]